MDVDIFDDCYRHIGVASQAEAHRRGLWHRVFTCLVVHPRRRSVTLQFKRPGRYSFERPDLLDVSVGGHYEAGEGVEDGVREIKEELGLEVEFLSLIPIGIRQTAATLSPAYVANEFQHVFLLPTDHDVVASWTKNDEVRGLIEVPLDSTIDLLLGDIDSVVPLSTTFDDGEEKMPATIGRADFPPNYLQTDQFIVRLFIAAQRWLRGDAPNRIFW